MAARARKENETFKQYRQALKIEAWIEKHILSRGKLIWNAEAKGTYNRKLHGELKIK